MPDPQLLDTAIGYGKIVELLHCIGVVGMIVLRGLDLDKEDLASRDPNKVNWTVASRHAQHRVATFAQ